jgi:hypothetical protein
MRRFLALFFLLAASAFAQTASQPFTLTVNPGGSTVSQPFTLTVTPAGATVSQPFSIVINQPSGGGLIAVPTSLSFGTLRQSTTGPVVATQVVTLQNQNSTAATLTSIGFTLPSIPAMMNFSVDPSSACQVNTVVAAGGSCALTLDFTVTPTPAIPSGTSISYTTGDVAISYTLAAAVTGNWLHRLAVKIFGGGNK